MKISLTILFLPSPSLPPKTIKNWPNYVEEWQFLVDGGEPSNYYYPPAAAAWTISPWAEVFAYYEKVSYFWENILAAKALTFGTVLTLIIFQPNSTISEVWFGRPSPSSPCTLGCPEMNDYIAIFYLLCGGTIFIKLSSVLYKIYTLVTLKKFAPLFLLYF